MRVLLVANYAGDRQESMLRFADMMQQGLLQAGHEVRVIQPPVRVGARQAPAGLGKWLGYVDKFLVFPPQLRRASQWADIVHICDHSNAMYSAWTGQKPSLVTCHDMLAVRGALGEDTDCPASTSGKVLQRWIVRGLRRADSVAAVSSATAADCERITHRPPARVATVLNALNYPYREDCAAADLLAGRLPGLDLRKPFVLHVGSNLPRKNKLAVIQAFARASSSVDLQLVFAGPPLTGELRKTLRAENIEQRTIEAVKPDNELLQALYNTALCLLFPSRFEGFGWPLIEAQACGCPVLCSRCGPFSEVVGEAALMRDADDVDGFARDIELLATSPSERERLREAGRKNVRRFSPDQMIARYLELYGELV